MSTPTSQGVSKVSIRIALHAMASTGVQALNNHATLLSHVSEVQLHVLALPATQLGCTAARPACLKALKWRRRTESLDAIRWHLTLRVKITCTMARHWRMRRRPPCMRAGHRQRTPVRWWHCQCTSSKCGTSKAANVSMAPSQGASQPASTTRSAPRHAPSIPASVDVSHLASHRPSPCHSPTLPVAGFATPPFPDSAF